MKTTQKIKKTSLIIAFLLFAYNSGAQIISNSSGNWSESATWVGGIVPNSADNVLIADGHVVIIDQDVTIINLTIGGGASGVLSIGNNATARNITINGVTTINNGASFIVGAFSATHLVAFNGAVTNYGILDFYNSSGQVANVNSNGTFSISGNSPQFNNLIVVSGTLTLNIAADIEGAVVINTGAVLNDGGYTHTVAGNWTENGTFTSTGTIIMNAPLVQSITETATFNNLTFNSGAIGVLGAAIIVTNDFIIDGNTKLNSSSNLTVLGNFTVNDGSKYVCDAATTIFSGSNAQIITIGTTLSEPAATFYAINFDNGGSNPKTIVGNIVSNAALYIFNDAIVEDDGDTRTHILNGIRIDGTCNFSGMMRLIGGTCYNGSGNTSFTMGTAEIIIAGGVYIGEGDNMIVNNDITIESGYLVITGDDGDAGDGTAGDATLTGQAGQTLLLTNNTSLYVRGINNFPTGFGTITLEQDSYVRYDDNRNQTIYSGVSYGRLVLSNNTKTAAGNLDINSHVYLYNGVVFNLGDFNHTIAGDIYNWDETWGRGSISATGGTVTLDAADASQTIYYAGTGTYTFNNLALTQSAPTQLRYKRFQNDITINGDFTATNIGGDDTRRMVIDFYENEITGGTINFSLGANVAFWTSGENSFDNSMGRFGNGITLNVYSTIRYYRNSGSQSIRSGNRIIYGNIELYGNCIKEFDDDLDINGNILSAGGTPILTNDFAPINVAGNWLLGQAYTNLRDDNVVIFDGLTTQSISASNFAHVQFSNSGSVKTQTGTWDIAGDLTIDDGVTVQSNQSTTIEGNWLENGSGIFHQTAGTVTFDGTTANQTVTTTANSFFYNFYINKTGVNKTVTANSDLDINGTFNFTKDNAAFNLNSRDLFIERDFYFRDGCTFAHNNGKVYFDGESYSQLIRNYSDDIIEFGDVDFVGTAVKQLYDNSFSFSGNVFINNSTLDAQYWPHYVQGNWTNTGIFRHSSILYFNGNGNQTIGHSSFNTVVFRDGDNAGDNTKTLTGNIICNGDLVIDNAVLDVGSLNNSISIEQNWDNDSTGSFIARQGKVTILGDYNYLFSGETNTIYGASGHLTTQGGTKSFYDLEINLVENTWLMLRGALTVANDLTITNGNLYKSYDPNNYGINDISIGGSYINHGQISYTNYGCRLNLTAGSGTRTFDPGSSNTYCPVIFNGTGTYNFQSNLNLNNDRAITITNTVIDLNSNGISTHGANGDLTLNSGSLEVDSAAFIDMGANSTFTNIGGTFRLVGSADNQARIFASSGNYTFLQTGGTIHASNYSVEGTSGNGIDIQGGNVDAINSFQNGTFSHCNGTACLSVNGIDFGAGGRTLQGVIFNSGPTYNVQRTSGVGTLVFENATGTLSGEDFDNDNGTNTLIDWTYPGAKRWDGGGGDGNWHTAQNWSDDLVPDNTSSVILDHSIVAGAYNVGISSNTALAQSLLINDGGTPITLSITGQELHVSEDVTIGASSSLTASNNEVITVGESWSNEGTFAANNSTVVFNPVTGTHSISAGISAFNNLHINGTSGIMALSSDIDINGNIQIQGGTFNGASYIIELAGNWIKDGGTFIPGTGTVNFDNTGAQSISGGDFYNVILSGSGTKSATANMSISNTLTISSGTVFDGGTSFIYIGNDWINRAGSSGFVQTGSGTVIFNGISSTQDIGENVIVDAAHATTFNNLTLGGLTTKYFQQNTIINNNLIISGGYNHILSDITITGAGTNTLSQSNGTLYIRGTNNFPSGFESISLTGGYVDYYADANQTVYPANYYNLRLRNETYAANGNIYTKTIDNNISANYIEIYDFETILDVNNFTITLAGDLYVRNGGIEPVWNGGTIIHNGETWIIDNDITTLHNVIKRNNGYLWLRYKSLNITGDVSIRDNAILRQEANTVMTCTGIGKTLSMSASTQAYIYTDAGSANDTLAFPTGFANYDLDVNSTVYLRAIDDMIVNTTPTYGRLYIYTDAEVDVSLNGILDVNGDFRMYYDNPTLIDNGFNMNLAGSYIDIRTYTPTPGTTITFDGVDQQIVNAAAGATELVFANVIFAGSGQKSMHYSGDDWYNITGDLTINSGITVYIPRRLDFSGANWINNGTFNHTANVVNFNGIAAQTINPGLDNNYYAVHFSGGGTKAFIINGIDVDNGVFEIEAGTTVNMGTLTHEIASIRVDNSGTWTTANASFIFDRNATQYLPGPTFVARNIICRRTDQYNRVRYLEGDIVIDNLTIEEGIDFRCSENAEILTPAYNITLTGNFTNYGQYFYPWGNTVFFESNNSDPKTITQGNGYFHNVSFNTVQTNSRVYSLQDQANFYEDLTINSGATLDLNGQILRLGNNDEDDPVEPDAEQHTINSGGTLEVDAGASLEFSCYDLNNTVLNVYGTLRVVGTDGNNATITQYQRQRDNRIDINVVGVGAAIQAQYYLFEYLSNDGLLVDANATIHPTNNFSNGTWSNMSNSSATYLHCNADVSGIGTIDDVTFNFSTTPTQGTHFNVRRESGSTGTLAFGGKISGLLGGENYEADPTTIVNPGLITWPPVSEYVWDGSESTDWFDPNNWTPASVPSANETAVIPQETNNPVINGIGAICKDLRITDGLLTLQGGFDLNVDGDVYIGTGNNVGILALDDAGCTINVSGSWTRGQNGLFLHGGGTIVFDAAGGNVSIDPRNSAFGNLEFDGGANFLLTRTEIFVDNNFVITNGTVTPTLDNYRLRIKGDYNNVGGSYATATVGTVFFEGADQTITNGDFWNLTIDGSGTKSSVGPMTLGGNLSVQNSLFQAGDVIDIDGNVTIESTGTFNDGGQTHTFGGVSWTGTGGYSGSGTIIFNRTAGQQIYASKFNNLILANTAEVTLYGDVSLTGNLEINAPNTYLNLQTYALANDGTGMFIMESDRTLYVMGANNFPGGFLNYNLHETSRVRYDGSVEQTIAGTPVVYGSVYLSNSSKILGGDADINGILYFYENSSLDVTTNNYRINIEGHWYNQYGATFTPREGEVIFDGNDDNTYMYIYEASRLTNPFFKLTINKSNGYLRSYWTDITVQDNLRVLEGILYQNATMYVGGDMSAFNGTYYPAGTYYLNKIGGSSNLQLNGSILNNLTINSTATYYLQDDLKIYGNLNILAGTFNGNGNEVDLGDYGETHSISGTYIVGPDGILRLSNYGTFSVLSGAEFFVLGEESNIATVSNVTGRYYLNIENGGKIYAEHYMFEYMAEAGIYIKDGGIIDNNHNFSNGTFTNIAPGGTALRIENSQSFTQAGGNPVTGVSFPLNPNGGAYNVTKITSSAGTIDFEEYSGEFTGEDFDYDPNNFINWIDPPFVTWTGAINNDWYNIGNWKASSGADRVPLITDNVIIPQKTNQPVIGSDGAVAKSINLQVNAYLTLSSAVATSKTLTVAEDFEFAGTLIMTTGNDTLAVGGNFNNSGLLQAGEGTVVLNSGTGNVTIDNYTSTFYNLQINTETTVLLARNITVNNEFKIVKGTFDAMNNGTLTVRGDFYNFGTYIAHSGKLILGGSLASHDYEFNPGTSSYYNVDINAGTASTYNLTSTDLSITNLMTVNSGTFNLNSRVLNMGDGLADVLTINGGVFSIDENAYLRMANGSSISINSGGTFKMVGTNVDNPAYLQSQSGTYGFTANSGSIVHAQYYNIQFVNSNGIYLRSGATIDATDNFSYGVFRNGTSGGQFLWFQNDFSDFTVERIYFHNGASYNIRRQTGIGIITFEDALGLLEGALNELDDGTADGGLVHWEYTHDRYTWTGVTNTDWNTASNWNVEILGSTEHYVPNNSSTAIIPDVSAGSGNNPILDGTNGEVYDLRVENGGLLTINGNTNLTAGNTLIVGAGGVLTIGNGSASTISVADIWSIDGTFNHGGNSTVVFNAPSGKVLTITGASDFYNLTINSSGVAEYTTASSLNINGNFNILQGSFTISEPGHVIYVGGNWTNNASFNNGSGVVNFNGQDQNISNTGTGNFYNVVFNGSGNKFLMTDITVGHNLIIESNAILEGNGQTLTVHSNWTNRGRFIPGIGSVAFSGTSPQVIDKNGEENFYRLELNNSASEFPQFILYGDIRVLSGGTLSLTDGVIETTGTYSLTIEDNVGLIGGDDDDSYISGPIIKEGNDGFVFPIGDGLKFARIAISGLSGLSTFEAQYFENPYSDITSINQASGIDHVSGYEYWNLDRISGAGEPTVTFYWEDGTLSGIDNLTSLRTARYDGAQWENTGNIETIGDVLVGKISSAPFTDFGPCGFASADEAENPLNSFSQWTGSESTVWNDERNWSGGVPNLSRSARIGPAPAFQPVISINAECMSLTIEEGASVIVNPTYSLTVGGELTLNGSLRLNSNTNGHSALINRQAISYGPNSLAVAECFIRAFQYQYVSTPIRSQDSPSSIFKIDASAPYYNPNLYWYDETNVSADYLDGWTQVGDAENMNVMQGYAYYMDRNTTAIFNGQFNTGDRSISVSYTDGAAPSADEGWNLLGNPYPAPIDWDAVGWTKNNIDNAIYFWNGTNYSYYIGSGGTDNSGGLGINDATNIIPAMQGFMVKSTGAGSLVVPESARIISSQPFYKKKNQKSSQGLIVKLIVDGDEHTDETAIRFIEGSTNYFDSNFDAYKLFTNAVSVPQLYSILNDSVNTSINTLPEIGDSLIIPIGFKTLESGTFTITANDIGTEVEIWFEDLSENRLIDLYNINYTFSSSAGEFKNRFRLVFYDHSNKSVTGEDDNTDPQENPYVQIYSNKDCIYLKSDVSDAIVGDIEIYNMSGYLLKRLKNNYEGFAEITVNYPTGIYLVNLITKYGHTYQKLHILRK